MRGSLATVQMERQDAKSRQERLCSGSRVKRRPLPFPLIGLVWFSIGATRPVLSRQVSGCRSRLFALDGAVAGSVDDVTFAITDSSSAMPARPSVLVVIAVVGQPVPGGVSRQLSCSLGR